ncbi:MAG: ATP-binding cassette domain-containing protein [Caldilineaceae bacterium]
MALDNVDLTVKQGEVLGLLGGNGAVETTLMNVLFGLYKADAGSIELDGRPLAIRRRAAIDHGIGAGAPAFSAGQRLHGAGKHCAGRRSAQARPTMHTGEAEGAICAR